MPKLHPVLELRTELDEESDRRKEKVARRKASDLGTGRIPGAGKQTWKPSNKKAERADFDQAKPSRGGGSSRTTTRMSKGRGLSFASTQSSDGAATPRDRVAARRPGATHKGKAKSAAAPRIVVVRYEVWGKVSFSVEREDRGREE